jgi:adenylate cyclase
VTPRVGRGGPRSPDSVLRMSGAEPVNTWIAAGIYDPGAPDAADHLELLTYLHDRGISLEELIERHDSCTLTRAAVDAVLHPTRALSLDQAAGRSGLTREQIERAWLAFGLPVADDLRFNEAEIGLLDTVAVGGSLLGPDAVLQIARVMGLSMARLAESAVFGFLVNVEQPMVERGQAEVELARSSAESLETVLQLPEVFPPLFQRHLETVIERQRASRGDDGADVLRLAVGFVDLVGYTEWSETVPIGAQGAAMADFERATNDEITARGGRVVKNIGDAVMFVVTDLAAAAAIALDLCVIVAAHPGLPDLRGAVGYGDLLGRDGDYFGPMVNLVARAVDRAPVGRVLATEAIDGFRCKDLGPTPLRGFDPPPTLYSINR